MDDVCQNWYSQKQGNALLVSTLRNFLQLLQEVQLQSEAVLTSLETTGLKNEIIETSLNHDEEKESLY